MAMLDFQSLVPIPFRVKLIPFVLKPALKLRSCNSAGLDSKLAGIRGTNHSIIISCFRAYAKFAFWDSSFDLHSEETKAQ